MFQADVHACAFWVPQCTTLLVLVHSNSNKLLCQSSDYGLLVVCTLCEVYLTFVTFPKGEVLASGASPEPECTKLISI